MCDIDIVLDVCKLSFRRRGPIICLDFKEIRQETHSGVDWENISARENGK